MGVAQWARTRAVGTLAGALDDLLNERVLIQPRRDLRDPTSALPRLEAIAARVSPAAHITDEAETFFPAPPLPDMRVSRSGRAMGRPADKLSWASELPLLFDEVRERYQGVPENREARALYVRGGDTPRPVAILIHGFMGGERRVETLAWPIRWFLRQGMDVVIPVLPFHGPRGARGRRAPVWPGRDIPLRAEGFRQAMWDLRGLVRWLRERGHPLVGVMGMSLGGYTTALLATLEADLDFAVPMIPLASFPDWTRDAGHIGGGPVEQSSVHDALERAHAAFSPLARPLKVPRERVFVAAAERDGVTPIAHARRIADHFDVPLVTFHGGHLIQAGRGAAFRRLAELIELEGR